MRKRKTAINTAECVLPKDIDRLHPVILRLIDMIEETAEKEGWKEEARE